MMVRTIAAGSQGEEKKNNKPSSTQSSVFFATRSYSAKKIHLGMDKQKQISLQEAADSFSNSSTDPNSRFFHSSSVGGF